MKKNIAIMIIIIMFAFKICDGTLFNYNVYTVIGIYDVVIYQLSI